MCEKEPEDGQNKRKTRQLETTRNITRQINKAERIAWQWRKGVTTVSVSLFVNSRDDRVNV